MARLRNVIEEVSVRSESEDSISQIVVGLHAGSDAAEEARMSESNKGVFERYRALVHRAGEVFGDDARASLWLSTPSIDLDGRVPLEIAAKDGYSLTCLEPIFARIEHGIDF